MDIRDIIPPCQRVLLAKTTVGSRNDHRVRWIQILFGSILVVWTVRLGRFLANGVELSVNIWYLGWSYCELKSQTWRGEVEPGVDCF